MTGILTEPNPDVSHASGLKFITKNAALLTPEEHAKVLQAENMSEYGLFYRLLWEVTGHMQATAKPPPIRQFQFKNQNKIPIQAVLLVTWMFLHPSSRHTCEQDTLLRFSTAL
ncbi:MAG: hypothetical protein PHD76_07970 [Methylacidiphilales bacterium]|nr:hypothetical protein [Candidatus Methylacidiphilales bacterium]